MGASSPARISAFFDPATNSVSYLVADPASKAAAIIDPVLDFDPGASCVETHSADAILAAAAADGLTIAWVLETHPHADHLSAARLHPDPYGREGRRGRWHSRRFRARFGPMFDADDLSQMAAILTGSSGMARCLPLATSKSRSLRRRGTRRPASATGSAMQCLSATPSSCPITAPRAADFPGGDARQLYRSIRRILALPRETRLFLCHDYKAPHRDRFVWETTVGDELDGNVHIHGGVSEEEYVAMRHARDATLERRNCSIRRSR